MKTIVAYSQITFLLIATVTVCLFTSSCAFKFPVGFSQTTDSRTTNVKNEKTLIHVEPISDTDSESQFFEELKKDFLKKNFAAIEQKLADAQANKTRLSGGRWKGGDVGIVLHRPVGKSNPTDEEWKQHLAVLEEWRAKSPGSIFPLVALAGSYKNYAWNIRGSGYAGSVKDENLESFRERIAQGAKYLALASQFPEKSLVYYEELLALGVHTGWSYEQFDEAFRQAIDFEPDCQDFYLAKAVYLLPRWHGKPGDWERFAEDTMNSIGGKKGAEMYYQIVSNLIRMHGLDFFQRNKINWEKFKEGFIQVQNNFGNNRKMVNELARMALFAGDVGTACQAFISIGDDYDEDVWRSKTVFEQLRRAGLDNCNNTFYQ